VTPNADLDLIAILKKNARRLDAIEDSQTRRLQEEEEDDGPTTAELSSQIQELWQILQMMQKHYVQLMKDSKGAETKKTQA
jgi:hypothetical protein